MRYYCTVLQCVMDYTPLLSAYHTVVDEGGWVDGVQETGILSAQDRAPHQAVRGVVVKLCSMTLPDNRSSMRAALYGMTF